MSDFTEEELAAAAELEAIIEHQVDLKAVQAKLPPGHYYNCTRPVFVGKFIVRTEPIPFDDPDESAP